jgi:hypothetical protein
VRLARLAQVHVHIDEAGRDEGTRRIEDAGVRSREMLADRSHDAVAQQDVAHGVEGLRRIDDAPAANE